MSSWYQELFWLVDVVLRHPPSQAVAVLRAVLGLAGLLLVVRFAARASSVSDSGWVRRIVAVVFGVAALLGGAAASSLFVVPRLGSGLPPWAVVLAGAALVLLVVVAPIQALILKTKYVSALLSFAAGMACFVMIVLLLGSVSDSAKEGGRQFKKVKRRTGDINEMIR